MRSPPPPELAAPTDPPEEPELLLPESELVGVALVPAPPDE